MKNTFLSFAALFMTLVVTAQTTYYVNQQSGNDNNNGLNPNNAFKNVDTAIDELGPGDTLFFIGEFTNENFDEDYVYGGNIDDPYIWKDEHTVRINGLNGSPNNYITLKAFDENTVLRGDGSNILRVTNSSYIKIEDFEIEGIVEQVSLDTALALQFLYREDGTPPSLYRVQPGTSAAEVENMTFPVLNNIKRPSYTDTRGIYFSNSHHLEFTNNEVHHTTGNGFRVQGADYVKIIGNEVHNCSRKSYSGTHGLVVTNASSVDNNDDYKIFIERNEVHHNYNEIYSWAPSKTFITPRIDEGKGISLQRNDLANGWDHGRILVANNLTYWNGFSGVHSNTGLRLDFINNTAYMNSYTNTVTYANEEQNGRNIGISAQGGSDNKIINNVIFIDNAWGGFPISVANEPGMEIRNNVVFGINGNLNQDSDATAIAINTIIGNPLFVDADNNNFGLMQNSPAVGAANAGFAPEDDFYGFDRDNNPDAGAIEYDAGLGFENQISNAYSAYPNPTNGILTITTNTPINTVEVFSVLGNRVQVNTSQDNTVVDFTDLASGLYIVKVNSDLIKVIRE